MSNLALTTIASTPSPGKSAWVALHQCVSQGVAIEEADKGAFEGYTESQYWDSVIRNALEYGHWGVVESQFITLNCSGFPHHTMVQLRTHRNLTFDVQSFRYTGDEYWLKGNATEEEIEEKVEQLFYCRDVGKRYGNFVLSELKDQLIRQQYRAQMVGYSALRNAGVNKEVARAALGDDRVQNFVVGGSLRAFLHLFKLRGKANAQTECVIFTDLLRERINEWVGGTALLDWYFLSSHYTSKPCP